MVRFARGPRRPCYERNLPHWLPEGKNLFVTGRLYRLLPGAIVEAVAQNPELEGRKVISIQRVPSGSTGFRLWDLPWSNGISAKPRIALKGKLFWRFDQSRQDRILFDRSADLLERGRIAYPAVVRFFLPKSRARPIKRKTPAEACATRIQWTSASHRLTRLSPICAMV